MGYRRLSMRGGRAIPSERRKLPRESSDAHKDLVGRVSNVLQKMFSNQKSRISLTGRGGFRVARKEGRRPLLGKNRDALLLEKTQTKEHFLGCRGHFSCAKGSRSAQKGKETGSAKKRRGGGKLASNYRKVLKRREKIFGGLDSVSHWVKFLGGGSNSLRDKANLIRKRGVLEQSENWYVVSDYLN